MALNRIRMKHAYPVYQRVLVWAVIALLMGGGRLPFLSTKVFAAGPRVVLERQQAIYSVDDQTPPPHNEVHFPYLHESGDGTWYMAHHEGPHHAGTKVFGLTWEDELARFLTDDRPQTVMSTDQGQTWRPWPGMPHRVRDLRLAITTLRDGTLVSHLSYLDDIKTGTATLCLLYSDDDGATWTRRDVPVRGLPLVEGQGGSIWGRLIEVTATHSLLPYYGQQNALDDSNTRYFTGLLESHDGRRTWQHLAVIAGADTPGEEGPNEADIVHLGDDELYAIFRTGDKEGSTMYESRSLDLGKSWTQPTPYPGGEEGVSPQLRLLDDQRLVLVFGRRVLGDRAIVARASADRGHTWCEPMRVYEGDGKVYANLQVVAERRLRVAYDASPVEHDDGRVTNNIMRAVLRIE